MSLYKLIKLVNFLKIIVSYIFSVHLKIHVPQIIKDHIHTKTVYVNSKPKKNKKNIPKKTVHLENHHEDESTWNSYHRHHGKDDEKLQKNNIIPQLPILINKFNFQNQAEPPIPFYDDYKDNSASIEDFHDDNLPAKLFFNDGIMGYAYPPQYDQYENINNDDYNYEKNLHNEKYKRGQQIQNGHIFKHSMKNFYDNNINENSASSDSEENYGYNYFTKMLT